jgi:hypothetical protein
MRKPLIVIDGKLPGDDVEQNNRAEYYMRKIAAELRPISRNFQGNAARFLCAPDGVAEGEGFEPPVRFPVQRFSRTQEGSDRL